MTKRALVLGCNGQDGSFLTQSLLKKNYEVYDVCPQGRVYELRIYSTILQSTFTILSFGIFSPRTVTIVCSIRAE